MATAAIAGYKGVFLLSTSTGGTPADVAEIRNFSISVEHAEIDATSHDSSGDREIIGGIGSWSATAEYLHVQANAGQILLFDSLKARNKILAEFYPTGSSSDGWYHGEGFLTSFELGSPNDDAAATNIGFAGSGVLQLTTSS